jgi:hypothetical protein
MSTEIKNQTVNVELENDVYKSNNGSLMIEVRMLCQIKIRSRNGCNIKTEMCVSGLFIHISKF